MLHSGNRYERPAAVNSGTKQFNGKRYSYRGVNSKNTRPKNHTDATAVAPKQHNDSPPYSTPEAANIPSWFTNYMDMFQKQVTADITRKVINNLDALLDDEETRARHKYSYFALRRRYQILEEDLAKERAKNPRKISPRAESKKRQSVRPTQTKK